MLAAEEIFGDPLNGRPVADLGRSCLLCCEQGSVAGFRLAPLVVRAGDVDPVPPPAFGGNQMNTTQSPWSGMVLVDDTALAVTDTGGPASPSST